MSAIGAALVSRKPLQYCILLSLPPAHGVIESEAVHQVMLKVDRGEFSKSNPYMDSPQSIGYGVTISAPHMVGV